MNKEEISEEALKALMETLLGSALSLSDEDVQGFLLKQKPSSDLEEEGKKLGSLDPFELRLFAFRDQLYDKMCLCLEEVKKNECQSTVTNFYKSQDEFVTIFRISTSFLCLKFSESEARNEFHPSLEGFVYAVPSISILNSFQRDDGTVN